MARDEGPAKAGQLKLAHGYVLSAAQRRWACLMQIDPLTKRGDSSEAKSAANMTAVTSASTVGRKNESPVSAARTLLCCLKWPQYMTQFQKRKIF